MEISQLLKNKPFYKFTGPPENWVTAINSMTWGLEKKYQEQWARILPGDIFFMHSTSTNTRVRGAQSAVIGFGVVGSNLTIENSPLWLEELETNVSKWSLRIPFSEIYLFSSFFERNSVPKPSLSNISDVARISLEILKDSKPLSSLEGFPQMGSISTVRAEVVEHILGKTARFFVVGKKQESNDYVQTPLIKLESVSDQNRYGTTLRYLEIVKRKSFKAKGAVFTTDPILLERAEEAHQNTLAKLKDLFNKHGYDTYFNRHVDLFATTEETSFLFEVKSIENQNFLTQARKGLVQLFEYEYFEVKKFLGENSAKNKTFKNIALSKQPKDLNYANFMNTLNLGICYFDNNILKNFGRSVGINILKEGD
jgi:hypothetical protein